MKILKNEQIILLITYSYMNELQREKTFRKFKDIIY